MATKPQNDKLIGARVPTIILSKFKKKLLREQVGYTSSHAIRTMITMYVNSEIALPGELSK